MRRILLPLLLIQVALTTVQAQDIDFPLPQHEIEKYESRVRMRRLTGVEVTHTDAYQIKTRLNTYPAGLKRMTMEVINNSGPTAEPEDYSMKHWKNGQWETFPFIDNLGFAGIGYSLSAGDTLPKNVNMEFFKQPLVPNRYQLNSYVFANIDTWCRLDSGRIRPVEETVMDGAFRFRVLETDADSIRILFENHTNLDVQPVFLPSIGTETQYVAHPLARSGWSGEAYYMRRQARLKGGEGLLFSIPTTWNVRRISDKRERERFKSGRLVDGKYKVGLQVEVYMTAEFDVKEQPSAIAEGITETNYLRNDSILWYGYEAQCAELGKYWNAHPEKGDSLQAVAEEMLRKANEDNVKLAVKYASTPSGLRRLFMVRGDIPKDTLENVMNRLSADMQDSFYGRIIWQHLQTDQVKTGSRLPEFPLTQTDGQWFDWGKAVGKQVLLVYGGLNCMGQRGRDGLDSLRRAVPADSLVILLYQPCGSPEELESTKEKYPMTCDFVSDFKQDASPIRIVYGAQAQPTCFLTDRRHIVKAICLGFDMEVLGKHIGQSQAPQR